MKKPRYTLSKETVAVALAMTVLGVLNSPASAQTSCDALKDAFTGAMAQSDLTNIAAAAEQVQAAATCFPIATRNEFARQAALSYAREAERVPDGPDAWPQRLKLLKAGERLAQPWQLMALMGDVYQEMTQPNGQKDRAAESLAYQAALDDIAIIRKSGLPSPAPQSPPEATIQKFTKLAQQARLASRVFVPDETFFRDPEVVQVPVPVQFIYDKAEMTTLGREYAEETFRLLQERGKPRITLIGHTDQVGNDPYNMDLSLRRAQAIKQFLVQQGYATDKIAVAGRGKREPLRIENEGGYSRQELDQIERRVEVLFR
jgi:outer membrane protein OmpA-like peptidoglycan-associated protein